MKKITAILFLVIYLVSVTEAHEFFKLPKLVQHYTEHKAEDKTTTLFNFLVLHYSHSDDTNEHEKLPFKSHNDCQNLATTGFITFNNYYLVVKSLPVETKTYNTHSIEFISSAYLSSIWQPPKSC